MKNAETQYNNQEYTTATSLLAIAPRPETKTASTFGNLPRLHQDIQKNQTKSLEEKFELPTQAGSEVTHKTKERQAEKKDYLTEIKARTGSDNWKSTKDSTADGFITDRIDAATGKWYKTGPDGKEYCFTDEVLGGGDASRKAEHNAILAALHSGKEYYKQDIVGQTVRNTVAVKGQHKQDIIQGKIFGTFIRTNELGQIIFECFEQTSKKKPEIQKKTRPQEPILTVSPGSLLENKKTETQVSVSTKDRSPAPIHTTRTQTTAREKSVPKPHQSENYIHSSGLVHSKKETLQHLQIPEIIRVAHTQQIPLLVRGPETQPTPIHITSPAIKKKSSIEQHTLIQKNKSLAETHLSPKHTGERSKPETKTYEKIISKTENPTRSEKLTETFSKTLEIRAHADLKLESIPKVPGPTADAPLYKSITLKRTEQTGAGSDIFLTQHSFQLSREIETKNLSRARPEGVSNHITKTPAIRIIQTHLASTKKHTEHEQGLPQLLQKNSNAVPVRKEVRPIQITLQEHVSVPINLVLKEKVASRLLLEEKTDTDIMANTLPKIKKSATQSPSLIVQKTRLKETSNTLQQTPNLSIPEIKGFVEIEASKPVPTLINPQTKTYSRTVTIRQTIKAFVQKEKVEIVRASKTITPHALLFDDLELVIQPKSLPLTLKLAL